MKTKSTRPTEFDEACVLSETLDLMKIEHWHLVQENPGSRDSNGKMKWGRIMKLKKQGWKKGVSDYMVYLPSTRTKCKKGVLVFIELKKTRTRKKSGEFKALSSDGINIAPEQIDFLEKMDNVPGIVGTIAYGADEALAFIGDLIKR